MSTWMPRKWQDIAERATWTLIQAGVGVAVVDALNLPPLWGVVAAGVLACIKGELASKFGDGSASTLPGPQPAGTPALTEGDDHG